MRVGVVIEGDEFALKTRRIALDWAKSWWPLDLGEDDEVVAFFINTRALDENLRSRSIPLEDSARHAGLNVVGRLEKAGESCPATGFRFGSLAPTGTAISLAAQVSEAVIVHGHSRELGHVVATAADEYRTTEFILISIGPSEHTVLAAEARTNLRIVDPLPRRGEWELGEQDRRRGPLMLSLSELGSRLRDSIPTTRGSAVIVDNLNLAGWSPAMDLAYDCSLNHRTVARWVPEDLTTNPQHLYWINPEKVGALTTDGRLSAHHSIKKSGFQLVTPPVDWVGSRRRAFDDGFIGFYAGHAAPAVRGMTIWTADKDLEPVGFLLQKVLGLTPNRIAPPPLEQPHSVTSFRVANSNRFNFHSLDEVFDRDGELFWVPSDLLPGTPPIKRWNRHDGPGRRGNLRREFELELKLYKTRCSARVEELRHRAVNLLRRRSIRYSTPRGSSEPSEVEG